MTEPYVTAHSLVDLPANHDIAIQACAEQLSGKLQLKKYAKCVLSVARYLYIATLALAQDAWLLTKAREALFQAVNMCTTSSILVQQMQEGVFENVKWGYGALIEGDKDKIRLAKDAIDYSLYELNGAVVNTRNALYNLQGKIEVLLEANLKPELAKTEKEIADLLGKFHEDGEKSGGTLEGQVDGMSLEDEPSITQRLGSPWALEIRLPRKYSNILAALAILNFFFIALIMINQYLSLWAMMSHTYPPLILLVLFLLLAQLITALVAIRAMARMEYKHNKGGYRFLLPFAPLFLFLNCASIVVIIYELSDLKNLPDSYIVWFAMALLVSQMLQFIVVGSWNYWGYRQKRAPSLNLEEEPTPSLDWDGEPMGTIQRDYRPSGALETKALKMQLTVDWNAAIGGSVATDHESRLKFLKHRQRCLEISFVVTIEAAFVAREAAEPLDMLMRVFEEWTMSFCMATLLDASQDVSTREITEEENTAIDLYYIRWRGLESFLEGTRQVISTTQGKVDEYYDDDPHPKAAVHKAFVIATEEESCRAVQDVVNKYTSKWDLGDHVQEVVDQKGHLGFGEYP